ncbi:MULTISPECIES: hypothetical protein [unclassified Hyphomicrobium]|uniref:hypothetical protein n=1 Tax=unclassified Hyphomicrobium TaxID=2619925 RepID=UPI00031024D9|nr:MULTISPECIES: hypothetical protein [unclassified Hyphomicrobium]
MKHSAGKRRREENRQRLERASSIREADTGRWDRHADDAIAEELQLSVYALGVPPLSSVPRSGHVWNGFAKYANPDDRTGRLQYLSLSVKFDLIQASPVFRRFLRS